ncbi:hypothetical protein EDB85DRAFT_2147067 [Lactarius pseudohatsudake]|nr:hypothetical protein EDB85DRAFT_2147067 [Lactarius pseudohatsudake]
MSHNPDVDEDFMYMDLENRRYKKFHLLVTVSPEMAKLLEKADSSGLTGPGFTKVLNEVSSTSRTPVGQKSSWDTLHNKYQVIRPASKSLRIDILASDMITRDQWGPIDGQEDEPLRSPTPKTPAPSPSIASNPEEIRIIKDQQEEEQLELIAESIPTNMSATVTQIAARTALFAQPTPKREEGGPPPGGDPGDDDSGGPGGHDEENGEGNSDENAPPPSFTNPMPDTDKFIGKEPKIFMGNRDEAEAFLSQWRRFAGVNATNHSMKVPYIKAMMFLTYIQGTLVDEWATKTTKWLDAQANKNDPWLWARVELAFKGQFRDNMEQDRARLELDLGFKMTGTDIDSYVVTVARPLSPKLATSTHFSSC